LLTGRARTVADLRSADLAAVLGPGADGDATTILEAAFARRRVAHAALIEVDADPARGLTEVIGAWSAADLPDLPATPLPPAAQDRHAGLVWPALATDRVRYPGQPIAAVVAERRATAEDGAHAVRCELAPLPIVLDPDQAAAPGAPQLFPGRSNVVVEQDFGDPADVVQRVFAAAEQTTRDVGRGAGDGPDDVIVVHGEFHQQRLLPTSLEPRAVLAAPTPDGGLVVWASHQAQHALRDALAEAFGLPADRVRVIVPATGGAFGAKSQTYPEYLVVAQLARSLGRPVRWTEDRIEAMLAATRGRGQRQRTRLAATRSGRFLAYQLEVVADIGGYPHTGASVPEFTGYLSCGAYKTPLVHTHLRCVLTTAAPTSGYRGAGRPEAAYAIERTVDLMSRRLGIDPAELRRRNHLRPDTFPYRTRTGRTYDSGDYSAALDRALDVVGYRRLRAEQAQRRREGGLPLGIGLATYVERSGGPPDSDEHGAVEACPDGTILARVGSTSTGQGHRTAFAQLVAGALDLPVDRVRVIQNDTAELPYGYGTFGSRSMQTGGAALCMAAAGLLEAARTRFAAHCGVPAAQARYERGVVSCAGRTASLADLAGMAAAAGETLRADRRPSVPQAFPFGAYVAVVEIDPQLGAVTVRRLVAVDDYGQVINPLIVDGQGHGSIAQGLGQALWEEAVTGPDGVPTALSLLDYLLPTAADMPPLTLRETRTLNPNLPHGAKGAGEAGCIGVPPAVVNAVCDALDVAHVDMPLTPEAVWRALRPGLRA
jgi:carbon-monoxide dehydrogenase large subunit